MKDASSTLTLRLDLSDATKYYFHPLADGIYENDGAFRVSLNGYIMQKKRINSQNPTSIKTNYARQLR